MADKQKKDTRPCDWLEPSFWKTAKLPDVRKALEAGADPNARDDMGISPLHRASSRCKNPFVIRALLNAGADVNAREEDGWTPLHRAASEGNRAAVVELLRAGADVSAATEEGSTALHMACAALDGVSTVKVLLSAGASLDAKDGFGETPEQTARACQNVRAVKAICDAYKERLHIQCEKWHGEERREGGSE